jgi:hypothetical protein
MRKKILIVVKTYPCPSTKYGELVCTAGIDEEGKWYRLYPIPFRNLTKEHRYKKYQWIDVDLEKDISDPRVESYKIAGDIIPLEIIDTRMDWFLRKKLLLHNIYINKSQLIYDCRKSNKQTSLAIFKPTKIVSFYIKTSHKSNIDCETYTLPFKFYYKFEDEEGKTSRLQIIDWEIGELTRKLLTHYNNNLKLIKDILRHKYFTAMQKRDVYLFLGTNREWHIRKSPNPFMIIGVFYPPQEISQPNLQIENKSFTNILKTNSLKKLCNLSTK